MDKRVLQIFGDLEKMDPALAQALQNIRAGKGTPQDANVLARGMYTDTMIPKMGNKLAYQDHLSRHENDGYHVHADMNDFGQINKRHGERMGDTAIKQFGGIASEVSRMFGGKAYRNGGDEFKFHFQKPEAAHGFARELRSRLEKQPKVGGTHNLAASIGIGFNPTHAEGALLEAKHQLGSTDAATGKRINMHTVGNAPTVIHSKTHEAPPPNWKTSKIAGPPPKATQALTPGGLKFHNPLQKDEIGHPGAPEHIQRPIPTPNHSLFGGSGSFGIMTADRPFYPTATQGGNTALEKELKTRGLKYEPVAGNYHGGHENSFLIHNVDRKTMTDLGNCFGQDAVIHSNQGKHRKIYTNGPKMGQFHAGEGHQIYQTEPETNYSTLKHNGQPTHFALNFDFDQTHPAPGAKPLPDHEE